VLEDVGGEAEELDIEPQTARAIECVEKRAWLAGRPMGLPVASKNDLGDAEVPGRPTMKQMRRAARWLKLSMGGS
jgi:hypothetical protein